MANGWVNRRSTTNCNKWNNGFIFAKKWGKSVEQMRMRHCQDHRLMGEHPEKPAILVEKSWGWGFDPHLRTVSRIEIHCQ